MSKIKTPGHKLKIYRGLIFVLSGPSGSGKTTLVEKLVKDKVLKRRLVKSVSVTTRPMRRGETEGRDYYFLKNAQFKDWLKKKKILEWTKYLGYYYATPRHFAEKILHDGKSLILSLDIKGARLLKAQYPHNTVTVFILPPSIKHLRDRIEKRARETNKEEVSGRLRVAKREMKFCRMYDYHLVNKNLETTFNRLKKIVSGNIKSVTQRIGR